MNAQETQEVFRGDLEECMKHYAERLNQRHPRGSAGAPDAKKPMADFCDVAIATATGWLYGTGSLPKGDRYLKLLCFLDLQGYRVVELKKIRRLKAAIGNFAELIGYGIISAKDACTMLGYGSTSSMYAVLLGKDNPSKDKARKMWDAWKESKDELERRKEERRRKYLPSSASSAQPHRRVTGRAKGHIITLTARHQGVVNIMEGLLSLLEDGLFEKLTPAELASLGSSEINTILQLSSTLSALGAKITLQKPTKEE